MGSGAPVVTRRILEVAARRRCRLVSTATAPIPNKTRTNAPIFPVEKKPAELELFELVVGATFGRPWATRIPLSLESVNQPPCVLKSKIGWPAAMCVQAPGIAYG